MKNKVIKMIKIIIMIKVFININIKRLKYTCLNITFQCMCVFFLNELVLIIIALHSYVQNSNSWHNHASTKTLTLKESYREYKGAPTFINARNQFHQFRQFRTCPSFDIFPYVLAYSIITRQWVTFKFYYFFHASHLF